MSRASEEAAQFNRELADLAQRLAEHDIVVRSLRCDWGTMGSWILEATAGRAEEERSENLKEHRYDVPGPILTRIICDGRDNLVQIDTTPTGVSSRRDQWTPQEESSFKTMEAALEFAERYLVEHLSPAAN